MRTLLARALRKAASIIGPASSQIDITDDYVKWLCFANAGMLDRGNLYLIDYALSRLRSNAPFLEIGSFCGLSANLITHYKRKHGLHNKLFTCDKWEFENDDRDRKNIAGSPVLFSDYKRFAKESYLRNIQTFSSDDLPFTIESFSSEFFDLWRSHAAIDDVLGRAVTLGGPFSFCYVDGNHSYEGAKLDFQGCDAFLEVGGFILFDDSTLKSFGVHQLMPEVLATRRYKLAAKNPNHLFQKISA
jgi:Methyltransferase domain